MTRKSKLLTISIVLVVFWALLLFYAKFIASIIAGVVVGFYLLPDMAEFILTKYEEATNKTINDEETLDK
jgi:hypothetical protein